MAPLSKQSTVVVTKKQVSSDLIGRKAILNLTSGVYYSLDAVGSRIWDLIQEPKTIGGIHTILLKEYRVEPDRLERDLLALFEAMGAEGLIDIVGQANSTTPHARSGA
jgi:hypothetical protein